jgi:hypothetical protein
MSNKLETIVNRSLASWVGLVQRRARWVLALTLAACVVSGLYVKEHLGVNSDQTAMLSPDLPYRQLERQFYDAFPHLEEPLVVVVDAGTPEQAARAIESLADALREEKTLRHIYVPGGGAFFEKNGLLYFSTEELEDLADHVASAQPYLAELSRDGSLRGSSRCWLAVQSMRASAPEGSTSPLPSIVSMPRYRRRCEANRISCRGAI